MDRMTGSSEPPKTGDTERSKRPVEAVRAHGALVRLLRRYLPLPVVLACYVFIFLKQHFDIVGDMDAKDWEMMPNDILLYAFLVVVPGLLIFVFSARWRIFKWIYLAVIFLWAVDTARVHHFIDGRHGCELCIYNFLGLVLITWPTLFVASTVFVVSRKI